MKKVLNVLLVVMILASSMSVFAGEVTTPGTGTAAVPLTVAATTFSVTVPMSLPIEVDAVGAVVSANTAKIINNSYGAVKVTGVSITGVDGWEIVSFATDMTQVVVNSKKIGFSLNTDTTVGSVLEFNAGSYNVMHGKNVSNTDEINLAYDAVVPAQSVAVTGDTVANVVFTLAWNN